MDIGDVRPLSRSRLSGQTIVTRDVNPPRAPAARFNGGLKQFFGA